MDALYEKRVERQIAQYASNSKDMHALPSIFVYWSETYLLPIMRDIYGVEDIYAFFYQPMIDRASAKTVNILSCGSGDGAFEVEIAKHAMAKGFSNFRFVTTEISPILCERTRELLQKEGLQDKFEVREADLNTYVIDEPFDVVMANHSLHHIVELEHLFGQIKNAMRPESIFIINDMIGRNGHMRWPEALDVLNHIWRELPIEKRINHAMKRVEIEYINHDCSLKGFEGIRAQDILLLLTKQFNFSHFVATCGFFDPIIDRAFGPNYSRDNPDDIAFLDRLQTLNQRLIDVGALKPTLMLGYAVLDEVEELRCFKHWTPQFCVRKVKGPPRLPPAPPRSLPRKVASRIRTGMRKVGLVR